MTKIEFIRKLSEATSFTQKDIKIILDVFPGVIADVVKSGDSVVIPGVGTAKSKLVPEKTGEIRFGDRKGEKWVKPEHREGVFVIAGSLKNIFEE